APDVAVFQLFLTPLSCVEEGVRDGIDESHRLPLLFLVVKRLGRDHVYVVNIEVPRHNFFVDSIIKQVLGQFFGFTFSLCLYSSIDVDPHSRFAIDDPLRQECHLLMKMYERGARPSGGYLGDAVLCPRSHSYYSMRCRSYASTFFGVPPQDSQICTSAARGTGNS